VQVAPGRVSFARMRQRRVANAFTFDEDLAALGFAAV
jgi:hypothetical protein